MTTTNPECEALPRPQPIELEPGAVVAERILEAAEPLRSDEEYRRQFYEVMGVQQVELQQVPDLGGHKAYLWDETVQPSGSYKSRGGSNGVLRTNPNNTIRTYSTGNHGTSVAIAGSRRGQKVIVDVPANIVPPKEQRLDATGAKVNKENPLTGKPHETFLEAEQSSRLAGEQDGVTLLPPFGHPDIVAGQCSAGFELVDEIIAKGLAHKKVVIPVPVAGAGYINGIAIPIWEARRDGRLGPNVRVVAVQPEGTDALNRVREKLEKDEPVVDLFGPQGPDKECDALAITEESLSPLTMSVALDTKFVDRFYTVDKASIGRAMTELKRLRMGKPVEPAAALAYAFAMNIAKQYPADGDRTEQVSFILPVTGSNVSLATERSYAAHAAAANREEFRQLSESYLQPDVRDEEEIQNVGRTATRPNVLGAHVNIGGGAHPVGYSAVRHALLLRAGVDPKEVQRRHDEVLSQMGIGW